MKLTTEQIKNQIAEHESKISQLQEELKKSSYVTGFERVAKNEEYRSIGNNGNLIKFKEQCDGFDNRVFEVANYGQEKRMSLLEKMNRLQRLLYRFSCENGGDGIDWGTRTKSKYHIFYENDTKTFKINRGWDSQDLEKVYFISEEVAKKALKQFIPLMEEIIKEQEEVRKYYLELSSKEKLTSSPKFPLGREFLVEDTIYEIIDISEDERGIIYEIEGSDNETDYDFETFTESELEQIILRGSFNE